MKKIGLSIIALMIFGAGLWAQKGAWVDTEYILNNIPAYESAQNQLDEMSQAWQEAVDKERENVKKMYEDYQNEMVLLSDDQRREREDAIIAREKSVRDLQRKYFGPEGELFNKREELVKPIQENVFNAVKEIATEGNYAFIIDTASSGLSVIYTDPQYDLSDEVLEKLGF